MEALAIPLLAGVLFGVIGLGIVVSVRNPQEFWAEPRRRYRRQRAED